MRRFAALLLSVAFVLVAAPPVSAETEPPGRVGRISFVSGQLAFHMAGETAWSAAAVNYPVASGGSFWTDPQSRAEIRIGAQTIDMAGNTEVDIVRLDEQVMQIAVPQGRIDLHLRALDEGNSVEIDTPRGGLWVVQPGVYDVDAGTRDQPTRVAVFDGGAHFGGNGVDLRIAAGEATVLTDGEPVTAKTERAAPDAFVQWCRSRDYRPGRLAAPYYLSPRMTGYEELDEYGSWRTVPDYGEVWFPSAVPADWAPYRDGHWIWVEPWGWTWVEAEPWGFAPFHYGRWTRIENRWAWVPGRFVPQPVYAPALVAFLGDPDAGIATRAGAGPAIGWFPLGPDEPYWPAYAREPAYIRKINVSNVSESKIASFIETVEHRPAAGAPAPLATQSFANRAAATVVPVRAFVHAARVEAAILRVPPQVLQQAAVSVKPPELRPGMTPTAPKRSGSAATAPAAAAKPRGRPAGGSTPHEPSAGLPPNRHGGRAAGKAVLPSTTRQAPPPAHTQWPSPDEHMGAAGRYGAPRAAHGRATAASVPGPHPPPTGTRYPRGDSSQSGAPGPHDSKPGEPAERK